MPNSSSMSDDELDLWSDINNPNNDADMDDWLMLITLIMMII